MLSILLSWFWEDFVFDQLLKQTPCVSYLYDNVLVSPITTHFTEWKHRFIITANIYVITDVPSIDFDSLYNKEWTHYFISHDWEVVFSNFGMPGPESNFIY